MLVPLTVTCVDATAQQLQCSEATTLGMALAEGEYWIGLTPIAPNGGNIHVSVRLWEPIRRPSTLTAAWPPVGPFGLLAWTPPS